MDNIKKEIKEIDVDKKINEESKNKKIDYWKDLALTDNLTKVYNRNGWDLLIEGLDDEEDLIFGIVDVDHFKKFNDEYGHDFGDEVLKKLAEYLDDELIVSRWGGEEFVFLAPCDSDNDEDVEEYLNKVREGVKKLKLSKKGAQISVSIGYTKYNVKQDVDKAFEKADMALFCAKDSGRNMVVQFGESMEELGCSAHAKDEKGNLTKSDECKLDVEEKEEEDAKE